MRLSFKTRFICKTKQSVELMSFIFVDTFTLYMDKVFLFRYLFFLYIHNTIDFLWKAVSYIC